MSRKRTREVVWQASLQTVYVRNHADHGIQIVATLEDTTEDDRPTLLVLTEDDAVRLASRLAFHIGGRIVLDGVQA